MDGSLEFERQGFLRSFLHRCFWKCESNFTVLLTLGDIKSRLHRFSNAILRKKLEQRFLPYNMLQSPISEKCDRKSFLSDIIKFKRNPPFKWYLSLKGGFLLNLKYAAYGLYGSCWHKETASCWRNVWQPIYSPSHKRPYFQDNIHHMQRLYTSGKPLARQFIPVFLNFCIMVS